MARVTNEDCLEKVPDRFELVVLATKRAREIAMGAHPLIATRNDKDEVVALREIASGYLNIDRLRKNTILEMHHMASGDESEEASDDNVRYEGVAIEHGHME
jgi:DNA-directed RNA polymerase subunit omega